MSSSKRVNANRNTNRSIRNRFVRFFASSTDRKRNVEPQTFLQFDKLEPRQMLSGDAGNLVFSAGFEDVDVPSGEFRFFRSVSGFTATNNPVEVQNNFPTVGPASEGTNLLELDGTNGVFVTINDVPSDGLILHGDYSPRPRLSAFKNTIEVVWNGDVISTLAEDGRGQSSTDFQRFEILLSGENSTGRLEFRSRDRNDSVGVGGLLDDIKIFTTNSQSPVLRNVADQRVDELETITVQLAATDADSAQNQLSYAALRTPVGSTLNARTGLFTWTPSRSAAGLTFAIQVEVSDETGLSDQQTFRISVDDVADAPVINNIADQTATVGQPFRVRLTATDTDSAQNQLRYTGVRIPVGATLNSQTGVLTWTPNRFAADLTFAIQVRVTDETGLSDLQTFRIAVEDGNAAPVFNTIQDQTASVGQPFRVRLTATDTDSAQNQLRYSSVRIPVGATLNSQTGVLTWTPNRFAADLTFAIQVRVTDETGLSDLQTFRIANFPHRRTPTAHKTSCDTQACEYQ